MQTLPLTSDEIAAWLRLTETPGLGPATARRLLAAFGLPEEIFKQSQTALQQIVGLELARLIQRPAAEDCEQRVADTIAWAAAADQHFVTLSDPAYPQTLLHLADPPLLLYVKGQLALLHAPAISIVGSRHATPQGLANAEQFAQMLSTKGFTIVSGLALGIDGAAHRGALQGHGGTVAVMGTGIDLVYPRRHYSLAQQIGEIGVLVSEWPLGTPARASHFPQRNRIIAALGQIVLVIEAAAQSGSLITARLAAEIGRDIGAIPGSIHSPLAKGCHQLIKQGAKLIESVQDLLDEVDAQPTLLPKAISHPKKAAAPLPPLSSKTHQAQRLPLGANDSEIRPSPQATSSTDTTNTKADNITAQPAETVTQQEDSRPSMIDLSLSTAKLDANSQHVLTALGYDTAAIEILAARTGLASATLQATLLSLELGGWITTLPGARVMRRLKPKFD